MPPIYTREQIGALLDARGTGATLAETARRLGIKYKSAFDILRRRGLSWPRRKSSKPPKGLSR